MTKSILLVGVGGQGTILASKILTLGLMEAGFDVKMSEEDHKLYEQRRVLEPGCDEYNRILQLQLKLYSDMEYPENIADLEKI